MQRTSGRVPRLLNWEAATGSKMPVPELVNDRGLTQATKLCGAWSGVLGENDTLRRLDQEEANTASHTFSGEKLKQVFRDEAQAR